MIYNHSNTIINHRPVTDLIIFAKTSEQQIIDTPEKTATHPHRGHAIKRYRHRPEITQEAFAANMRVSQALVLFDEQKRAVEDETIGKLCTVLNRAPEFMHKPEEVPVTVMSRNNAVEKGSSKLGNVDGDHLINNNPIEEILNMNTKMQSLYERMPEPEKEKNILLEKRLKDRE